MSFIETVEPANYALSLKFSFTFTFILTYIVCFLKLIRERGTKLEFAEV